jgi:GT2 family glycosyltransferase
MLSKSPSVHLTIETNPLDLVVIILNWNKPELTRKAVDSVKIPSFLDGQIIVADNGSSGDCLEMLKGIPGIALLPLKQNYGFAQGYNLAVAYAQERCLPRYIFLLNNDAQLEEKALENLYSQRERADILSPKIYYGDKKTLWACGGKLRLWQGWTKNIGQGEADQGQHDRQERIDFASGCALWLDSKVLNKVRLFAPEFVSYFEDVDFCCRAQKASFRILYVPGAKVYHEVSQTGGDEYGLQQSRIRWRNRLLMVFRNGRLPEKFLFLFLILPGVIGRDSFRYLRMKKYKELREAFLGLIRMAG